MTGPRVIATIAVLLAAAACSSPPTEAVITDKSHTPMYITYMPCGKVQCPITHPATFRLQYLASADPDTHWMTVRKSVWEQCVVGDDWHYDSVSKIGSCAARP